MNDCFQAHSGYSLYQNANGSYGHERSLMPAGLFKKILLECILLNTTYTELTRGYLNWMAL